MLEDRLETLFDDIEKSSDVDIVSLIGKSRLRMLMEDYQKSRQKDIFICGVLRMRQRRRNNAFAIAIKELLRECDNRLLHPIFFKGLFLATLLYERVEDRVSNDIDIVIPLEQFGEYNETLQSLGYVCEPIEGGDSSLGARYKKVKERHLTYMKTVENELVHIEVHTSVINPASLFLNNAQDFIASARQERILGMSPYLMDPEHNLVALSMHFFKHLPLTYFQNLIFGREYDINLLNVHDIANLIYKYRDSIDWDKILGIVKEMRVVKYFYFVGRFVNNIYGEIFGEAFLNVLASNLNDSQLSTVDSEKGGLGKLLWLFDIYIDYCIGFAPVMMLVGKLADGFSLITIGKGRHSEKFSIQPGEPVILERQYRFDIHDSDCRNVEILLRTIFAEKGLSVKYCVQNKSCCPIFSNDEKCYMKDGIEVIVVKECSVEHRMLTIKQKEADYLLTVYSNNNEKVIDISDREIVYRLEVWEHGFETEIDIPWSFLNVDSTVDKRFLLNIAGLVSDPISLDQERACCLFCDEKTIWDFRDIGEFEFKPNPHFP